MMTTAQRRDVTDHLTQGVAVGPSFMGFSQDILQNRSKTWSPDGMATDGVYFWHQEALPYIAEYGVGLPEEVRLHCTSGGGGFDWARSHRTELSDLVENHILPEQQARPTANTWYEPTFQLSVNDLEVAELMLIGDLYSRSEPAENWTTEIIRKPLDPSLRWFMFNYLNESHEVFWETSRLDDVLHPSWTKVAPGTIRTDGKYLWRSDYAHYVRMHGAAVPADLIERAQQFRPAQLSLEATDQLRDLLRSGVLRDPARQWLPA